MSSDPKPAGELMKYLPAVFSEDPFLAEYLSAFEKILVGADELVNSSSSSKIESDSELNRV